MTSLIWIITYTLDGEHSKSKLTFVTFERFTKASREKLFEISTDYQSYQTILPQYFPSVRVISVRPNTTLVEEHRIIAGQELVVMAKHIINDRLTHETFFVGGDAKGSHIIERYEQIPNGTKITVSVDFKPKMSMRFSKVFGKVTFLEDFERMIDKFIEISED